MQTPQTYKTPVQTPSGFPPQHQGTQPGDMHVMNPVPVTDNPNYRPAGKLEGRAAIITGADSGIGQAVAIAFAKEGADVAAAYLQEGSKRRGYAQSRGGPRKALSSAALRPQERGGCEGRRRPRRPPSSGTSTCS